MIRMKPESSVEDLLTKICCVTYRPASEIQLYRLGFQNNNKFVLKPARNPKVAESLFQK